IVVTTPLADSSSAAKRLTLSGTSGLENTTIMPLPIAAGVFGMQRTIDDESLMDAVTAVSGSGPAYIFHFIEALTVAAEKAGLPAETAKLLALQTVYGAASLAAESDEEPGVLRQQVTSPNGTTAAALAVLMGEDRLTKLLTDAVEAARLRSIELGK
ncbi:pyrroline-5-carboxylate reductase dimerization domain-containing protein, partial [Mesorhizobium sp.]|uniref:pyrroline-5-carboxylate reductase dimerization domain-containing protein n=1 Tax=Mesorhizobium sp. TaxID=1871066 RepID=UPI0025C2A43B